MKLGGSKVVDSTQEQSLLTFEENMSMLLRVLLVLLACTSSLVFPVSAEDTFPTMAGLISSRTRLLIVSPHPDDETLGAGGLIQRVVQAGGIVKVVFMTNGDGFPEGVKMIERTSHPTAQDFREYGQQRQSEALKALATLGVPAKDVLFLGFPDSGLCVLRTHYREDVGPDYTSPFTLVSHPLSDNIPVPNIEYNSEDLQRELLWILHRFRPSLVLTTHSYDQHPDHGATHLFVKNALQELTHQDPLLRPVFLTFLIHFGGWWPVLAQPDTRVELRPPHGFPEQEHTWLHFPLSPEEFQTKRQALSHYHSQMLVMRQYLLSFVRTNELFVRESLESRKIAKQFVSCVQ